jgi:hypothetical protein
MFSNGIQDQATEAILMVADGSLYGPLCASHAGFSLDKTQEMPNQEVPLHTVPLGGQIPSNSL